MKTIKMITALILAGFIALPLMAQEKATTQQGSAAPVKQVVKEESTNMKDCKMMDMCKFHMAKREMVALSDGCIVVLQGNKLYKYDANLVLQKEVELKGGQEGENRMHMNMEKPKGSKEKQESVAPATAEKPKAAEAKSAEVKK